MARRPLHEVRPYDGGFGKDDPLLKRAGRLTAVAKAVGEMDLNAIAATYQREDGASGLEAAAMASSALSAVIKSTMRGESGTLGVEREVQAMARRRAREARLEQFRTAQAEDRGPIGEIRRERARDLLEAKASKALDLKTDLLTRDMATRRAEREERFAGAATRRAVSEARVWLARGRAERALPDEEAAAPPGGLPTLQNDDPVMKRARALCSGAQRVAEDLERHTEMLRSRSAALSASRALGPQAGGGTATSGASRVANATSAEDAALIAKARELLSDYKPGLSASRSSPASPVRSKASALVETTGPRSRGRK